eukprot:8718361-Karenia_brevis.AAC.1
MESRTRDARHEIIDLLESIQRISNLHDDALDRSRSVVIEEMTRYVGVFRCEGERILDNMVE